MLKLTEAALLAMHTMVYLAGKPDRRVSTREIAAEFDASEAHLSKVLQRLARYGLVKSERGPKGGFSLNTHYGGEITLLDIYESIEGPLVERKCFHTTRICDENQCLFGNLLGNINKQVREYLSATRLPGPAGLIGGVNGRN